MAVLSFVACGMFAMPVYGEPYQIGTSVTVTLSATVENHAVLKQADCEDEALVAEGLIDCTPADEELEPIDYKEVHRELAEWRKLPE